MIRFWNFKLSGAPPLLSESFGGKVSCMVANNTLDDIAYYDRELAQLQQELSAVVRQLGRAAEANDDVAQEVETEALADRIRRLLYNHVGLHIGMA